jgi:hypothetical protein
MIAIERPTIDIATWCTVHVVVLTVMARSTQRFEV